MLRSLRLRLSLLYLVSALGLVALLGAGTYGLLALYFQRSTDLALQSKMAAEFRLRSIPLPSELAAAEQSWQQVSSSQSSGAASTNTPPPVPPTQVAAQLPVTQYVPAGDGEGESEYEDGLAPVFVLPEAGATPAAGTPVVQAPAAITTARSRGSDLRTVTLADGARLRLLTYQLSDGSILQVGRLLAEQERLLSQYLTGLFILGGIASLVLALFSWGLAGRSMRPVQRAWDQQQQFVSNASHELRSPLTLLRASADYALRNPPAEERQQALQDILGEVDYMNRLVEDLLLLSRLDAHRLVLASETVSVPGLLGEIARQVGKVAGGKSVSVLLDAAAGVVRGDPVRLRQVLLILLDNALRFTPAGGTIHLGAQVRGKWVSLYVADSGPGIPVEHRAHVFERFYQVPGQGGDGRGNGLGLSIAKALVEAQHGTIVLSCPPGGGTMVTIHLQAT